MAADPEIPFRKFVDCRDTRGKTIKVGIGATSDGRVVLMVPGGGLPVLNTAQAAEFMVKFRRVVQDASQRDG